jgi:hypothetical protein
MSDGKRISRRAALFRLGLGAASAYMAPSMVGLSQARASSASPASAPSPATPPSAPSPASVPSPVSPPSAPSTPSGPSEPGGGTPSSPSGPSGPGTCRSSSIAGNAQISRKDYLRAQRAIARGDARPLQEVLKNVQSKQPGKLLQVGFSDKGKRTNFRVLIVDQSGAVVSVTVDAGSGQITSIRKC